MAYFGRRPAKSDLELKDIYPKIDYRRSSSSDPYNTVYHLIEIDLTESNIQFISTDPIDGRQYAAQTVKAFATEQDTEIAINGNFFYPFESNSPWDYYPRPGELVELSGLAMNHGNTFSRSRSRWPALCLTAEPLGTIQPSGRCPADTVTALAGNIQTVRDGKIIELPDETIYSRTAIGLNSSGSKLWILIVDGKQPFYSEGATYFYSAKLLKDAGATDVLNLDGGGSTTLVVKQDGVQQVFNAPYHTRIVMRQRPVANHLGIQISAVE